MRPVFPLLVLTLAALAVCAQSPSSGERDSLTEVSEKHAALEPVARIALTELNECSGLQYLGGAFWAHNDSGAEARLYRSTELDFAKSDILDVPGADNVDWEDLAALDGDLLACDIGDNGRARESVMVYRVRYVPAGEKPARVDLVASYPIQYPDGAHDAEGAFVMDGKLHLVVKNRGEKSTTLFRLDELKDARDLAGKANVALAVGELTLPAGEQITAADFDSASGTLVLLSYTHIYRYSGDKLSGEPAHKTLIAARQCEAICFKGSRLVFANEQRDVYAVNGFLQTKYESMLPALGKAVLPVVKDAFEIDGTGEAWSNYRSEIALAGRGQDEHLGWLLAGDRLLLKGKLRYHGDFQSSRLVSSSLGSAVLLSFGAERRLNVAAQDVQIAIGDNGERGLEAWRMDLTGERIKLSRLQECQLKGSVKKGVLEFEASIAAGQVWGEKIPESFLFNAMTWKLRGERELQFSGEDIYSLFRPYLWGDVNLRRQ